MNQTTILVVDDDENNRRVLCDVLGDEPYSLLEAVDGQSALKMVEQKQPDLILLDVMMPGLDGMAVLGELQANDQTREIPVMMVTALGQDTNVSACLEAGAVDHVAKPFSAVVVRARVKAALRKRGQRKRGKLIGFIGGKGGVGNTTAVVNTALALATPQRQVSVVELRPHFGTLAQQLGITPQRTLQSLLGDVQPGVILRSLETCLTSHPSGLKLLFAPTTIDEQREISAEQAKAILQALAGSADFVLADLPFPPSPATRAAVEVCDFVVMTLKLDTGCIASAQSLLETLAAWGVEEDRLAALLAIHYASTAMISASEARQKLNCRFVGTIPPSLEQYQMANMTGVPMMNASPNCAAAVAFKEFSARLIPDCVQTLTF